MIVIISTILIFKMTSSNNSTTSISEGDSGTTTSNNSSSRCSAPRTEPLFVLYGSQTGNSEQAAEDFCKTVKEKFTPSFFSQHNLTPVNVQPTCIQLDDFLDYRHAEFTRTIVIFVSSYGVGQAPIGSYKFRSLADELLSLVETKKGDGYATLLKGLRYALCGLGDSGYTTYLVNPTTIDKALAAAGAIRIGEMGKADANAKKIGEDSQEKVIARWKEDLYVPLATTLSSVTEKDTTTDKDLKEMQSNTIPILMKLDPSYSPPKEFVNATPTGEISKVLLIVGLIAAIIAVLLATGMVDVHLW